ncbi:MAG: hypothetical protein KC503_29720, partial [Myxococcales bacterium]|nr:hypothetical protein [Myxococcales bacterium]
MDNTFRSNRRPRDREVQLLAVLLALALALQALLAAGCSDSTPASADGAGDSAGERVTFPDGTPGDAPSDAGAPDGDAGSGDAGADAADAGEWARKLGGHTVGDIVGHFAPLYYHDTDTGGPDQIGALADYFTAVDYDGDLRHDNNWDNLPGAKPQAMVYAALVASKTHYFITYSGYHARDW